MSRTRYYFTPKSKSNLFIKKDGKSKTLQETKTEIIKQTEKIISILQNYKKVV